MNQSESVKKKGGTQQSGAIPVSKWWLSVSRLVMIQLLCSLLMQLSYVAFPSYNFALALWCLACCTPTWSASHPKLVPFHMLAIGISIITDLIWVGLWVSGRAFYDQFCGVNGVSIISCGGATDYFPGCNTNRFALFTLILNDLVKIVTVVAIHRARALTPKSIRDKHGSGKQERSDLNENDSLNVAIHPTDLPKAPTQN